MPNDVIYVPVQKHRVFDGTNIPDMLDRLLPLWSEGYISASANYPGASATFSFTTDPNPNNAPQTFNYAVGDSVLINVGGPYTAAVLADDTFVVPLESFILDHSPAVPSPTLAVGYAVTPSLGIGASATVSVPMVPALPDSGYNVGVALAGSAQLLGALAILSATVVDTDTVNVVVQNNGLLTLGGATVLVTALHNG